MSQADLGSRRLFPELEPDIYLNHASLSPPSTPVQEAVTASLSGYARLGMSWYREEVERRERLRSLGARLFHASPETIALINNTSAGVLAIAHCLPWRRGERILLLEGEFPTNVTPWQQAARRNGLEIIWMDADRFRRDRAAALEELEGHLRQGVRLMAVSAVQFTTGQRMPLETLGKLCQQYGSEFFVDAIQAAGIVPLDVAAMQIDYLATGSHKWLMGPEGAGLLYVHPERADRLEPNAAGWLSHENAFAFLTEGPGELRYDRPFQPGARQLEAGTYGVISQAGLEASLELLLDLGVPKIFEHVQAWHDRVEPALQERGFRSARMSEQDGRSGILSLDPPESGTGPQWAQALAEHGVSCAGPDGWLRLAPHWPNALEETSWLLERIDAIGKKLA